MMIQKMLKKCLVAGCCLLLLSGCSQVAQPKEEVPTKASAASEGDQLIDSADLLGSVSARGDGQLTVQPQNNEKEGTAMVRAPGSGTSDSDVCVHYDNTCRFERATIDTTTGAVQTEKVSAEDVKTSSSVAIFGKTQDDGSMQATRIVILTYSGMDGE